MKPETRKTITDAFNAAIETSPYVDEIVPGIVTETGAAVTRRDLASAWLKDDAFFGRIDNAMADGKTLEQVIDKFRRGINTSILPKR